MKAPRDIRLRALWRDDPKLAPMTVDLRIDENGAVVGHWDVFGAYDLDGANCQPFILRRDGVIDLGAMGEPRSWRTNLRDVKMNVGVRFNVYWNDEDRGEYEIVKIAALGAKELNK